MCLTSIDFLCLNMKGSPIGLMPSTWLKRLNPDHPGELLRKVAGYGIAWRLSLGGNYQADIHRMIRNMEKEVMANCILGELCLCMHHLGSLTV